MINNLTQESEFLTLQNSGQPQELDNCYLCVEFAHFLSNFITLQRNNFQIETHNFKFTKHVSDDRHPSSVVNTSEPLVGVI